MRQKLGRGGMDEPSRGESRVTWPEMPVPVSAAVGGGALARRGGPVCACGGGPVGRRGIGVRACRRKVQNRHQTPIMPITHPNGVWMGRR